MRSIGLCVLLLTALAAVGGCDSDSSSGSLLAQGTTSVPAGDAVLATVTVTEPGTLRGVITWSGDPTEMEMGFKHVTPGTMIGISFGSPPITSTVAVTSARVAAGTEWQLLVGHGSATTVSVQFEVTFEPDCPTCP
ncbi:MAG: hypothetical protein JW889_00170 [Verrucomicrobia bacterium]|nr:hypothetical protein [Verrucomicrobiota bacterium]